MILREKVFQEIVDHITILVAKSSLSIFVRYDAYDVKDIVPIDYAVANPMNGYDDFPKNLDFDGVGAWYIFRYEGETFTSVKILALMDHGLFLSGQVGEFEGYKEDIMQYVDEDQAVARIIAQYALQREKRKFLENEAMASMSQQANDRANRDVLMNRQSVQSAQST